MKLFPDTAAELLNELERIVPERPSTPQTTREEDLAHGAKRELVLFIRRWHDSARNATPPIIRRQRR